MRISTLIKIININLKHKILYFLGLMSKIKPYKVLIQMTNDCNSRCTSCRIWEVNKISPSLKDKEMKFLEYKNLFSSYSKDLYWLALSGGEVTLIDEAYDYVKLAKEHCENLSIVTFTTNGILPDRALLLAKSIKSLGVDLFVTVSLDGDEALHDKTRGIKGNYQTANETFNLLKQSGITVHFGITLNNDNNEFVLNKYSEYSSTMKAVTFLHTDGIYNTKNTANYSKIASSMRHIYKNYKITSPGELLEKLYIKLGLKFIESDRKRNLIPCSAGLSSLHISPYGEVSPCMFLPSWTNVKKSDWMKDIDQISKEKRLAGMRGACSKCWMNCYAPHSMMFSPVVTILKSFKISK